MRKRWKSKRKLFCTPLETVKCSVFGVRKETDRIVPVPVIVGIGGSFFAETELVEETLVFSELAVV
jgi:hypothetical protein